MLGSAAMLIQTLIVLALTLQAAPPAAKRNLQVDDLFRVKTVGDPQVSPDGRWVAYTVATSSLKENETETQVWMAPTDGGEPLPMTAKGTSASQPRFSPDGKYLALPGRAAGGRAKRRTTPSRRCGCSTGGAARRSGSPRSRRAWTRSSGRPTARSWRC